MMNKGTKMRIQPTISHSEPTLYRFDDKLYVEGTPSRLYIDVWMATYSVIYDLREALTEQLHREAEGNEDDAPTT